MEFHILGAATRKARAPNISLMLTLNGWDSVADGIVVKASHRLPVVLALN